MDILISVIIPLALAGIVLTLIVLIVDRYYRADRYRGPLSDHFDGKYFYNIGWTSGESRRIERFDGKKGGLLTWLLERRKKPWKKEVITPDTPPLSYTQGVRITNVGHASYLIQVKGINILTDPVWSERASPWQWIGPRRYQDPGIRFEDLPPIDIVLLSHNHYDHMDITTLERLRDEKGDPTIYTGLGNQKYLEKRGVKNIVEMDWFDSVDHAQINIGRDSSIIHHLLSTITFLPAQHFSARGVTDRNRTLWGAFGVDIDGTRIYFGGDTGYGQEFLEKTRERYPDGFDIGLIPIGAYKPRWFMAPVHTDPCEGMEVQRVLRIEKAIGIHHSTFDLALDAQDDPIIDLALAREHPEYSRQVFLTGDAGTVWKLES